MTARNRISASEKKKKKHLPRESCFTNESTNRVFHASPTDCSVFISRKYLTEFFHEKCVPSGVSLHELFSENEQEGKRINDQNNAEIEFSSSCVVSFTFVGSTGTRKIRNYATVRVIFRILPGVTPRSHCCSPTFRELMFINIVDSYLAAKLELQCNTLLLKVLVLNVIRQIYSSSVDTDDDTVA